MLIHLVARVYAGRPRLAEWAVAARLWCSLRRAFPAALATVLMPNHLHLITPSRDPDGAVASLAHVLGALTRRSAAPRYRGEPGWVPVPAPEVVRDVHHLRRQLRYVALNPCRAGLVRDPLEWFWSTHRDVLGGVADPWVTAERLAAAVDARPRGFAARHHAYVSGDPSCHVAGTSPPRPARPGETPSYPLDRIRAAAATATRALPAAITARTSTRLLFVQLAARHGWDDARLLSRLCHVSTRAVAMLRDRDATAQVSAGELCLGDDRLCARWPSAS